MKISRQLLIILIFSYLTPGIMIYEMGAISQIILLGILFIPATFLLNIFSRKKCIYSKTDMNLFTLYLLVCVISILSHGENIRANLLTFLPGILIGMFFLKNKFYEKNFFVNVISLFVILQFLMSFLQFIEPKKFDSIFSSYMLETSFSNYHFKVGRIGSVWKEAPRFSAILVSIIPYLIYGLLNSKSQIKRYYLGICIFIGIITTIFTITRVSIIVLLIILMVYFFSMNKIKYLLPILVTILTLMFILPILNNYDIVNNFERLFNVEMTKSEFYSSPSHYNRLSIINILLPLVFESPFLGVGYKYQNSLMIGFSSAHNSFLHSLLVYGLPATIIMVLIIFRENISLFQRFFSDQESKYSFKVACQFSSLSLIVIGLFHSVLFDIQANILFWFAIGYIASTNPKDKTK